MDRVRNRPQGSGALKPADLAARAGSLAFAFGLVGIAVFSLVVGNLLGIIAAGIGR